MGFHYATAIAFGLWNTRLYRRMTGVVFVLPSIVTPSNGYLEALIGAVFWKLVSIELAPCAVLVPGLFGGNKRSIRH